MWGIFHFFFKMSWQRCSQKKKKNVSGTFWNLPPQFRVVFLDNFQKTIYLSPSPLINTKMFYLPTWRRFENDFRLLFHCLYIVKNKRKGFKDNLNSNKRTKNLILPVHKAINCCGSNICLPPTAAKEKRDATSAKDTHQWKWTVFQCNVSNLI